MPRGHAEDGEEKREKEVRESEEGLRDKGEKVGKARMGKVGLGTTTKAERGSVGTGRAGWDRTVVKRKETPSGSNEEKGWTRQETGVLRVPALSPWGRGKEPRAGRAEAEQGSWAAPSHLVPVPASPGKTGAGRKVERKERKEGPMRPGRG